MEPVVVRLGRVDLVDRSLDATPCAGAWGVRRRRPLAVKLGAGYAPGERRTAPDALCVRPDLQRVEEGESYRRAEMERRALVFLDLIAPRRQPNGGGS